MCNNGRPPARPGADVAAVIAKNRAHSLVFRNSRFLIALTMAGGVVSVFLALCMVILALSQFFPLHELTFDRGLAAAKWAFGAFVFASMCQWLWQLGRAIAFYQVTFEPNGAGFHLGTKKNPEVLFLAWDEIVTIEYKRARNSKVYTVAAKDGSYARFSSYTFFRPRKLARLVADRTGLPIRRI